MWNWGIYNDIRWNKCKEIWKRPSKSMHRRHRMLVPASLRWIVSKVHLNNSSTRRTDGFYYHGWCLGTKVATFTWRITARGVKPICPFQQVFKSTYLFGAFSPIIGDSLQLLLPGCYADNFRIFLNSLSNQNTEEFKIRVLDNGAFHKAKKLRILKTSPSFFYHHIAQN